MNEKDRLQGLNLTEKQTILFQDWLREHDKETASIVAREIIDYFFYNVGIVALLGCQTMEECKSRLPNWEEKLIKWGVK